MVGRSAPTLRPGLAAAARSPAEHRQGYLENRGQRRQRRGPDVCGWLLDPAPQTAKRGRYSDARNGWVHASARALSAHREQTA